MKRSGIVSYFLLTALLTSCSLLQRPQVGVKKEIRDVPQNARGEDANPRHRLMVLPFLDSSLERPQDLRDRARDTFISELNRTGEILVLDSMDLKLDIAKHILNGEYQMEALAPKAQELGVAALLEGKILDLRVKKQSEPVGVFRQVKTIFESKVRVRIVSSRSAKELFNTIKTVTIEESNVRVAQNVDTDRFLAANPQILENLVKESFIDFNDQILTTMAKLRWEGRIAVVNGDRIYLNVGRLSGLQIGDILKVTDSGEEVFDPQSGNYIGKVPGRVKGTLEVISYFGQDGAIAVIHSGSGFRENDRVELY